MTSPTARTLELLRQSGYQCATVEKWNAHAGIRQDLWGFADVIASHPIRREIFLVQVTTAGNLAARLAKAKSIPELGGWLKSGGRVLFHGWYKQNNRWEVKIVGLRESDFGPVVIQALRRRNRCRQRGLFDEMA
jgi:hypothetical protein